MMPLRSPARDVESTVDAPPALGPSLEGHAMMVRHPSAGPDFDEDVTEIHMPDDPEPLQPGPALPAFRPGQSGFAPASADVHVDVPVGFADGQRGLEETRRLSALRRNAPSIRLGVLLYLIGCLSTVLVLQQLGMLLLPGAGAGAGAVETVTLVAQPQAAAAKATTPVEGADGQGEGAVTVEATGAIPVGVQAAAAAPGAAEVAAATSGDPPAPEGAAAASARDALAEVGRVPAAVAEPTRGAAPDVGADALRQRESAVRSRVRKAPTRDIDKGADAERSAPASAAPATGTLRIDSKPPTTVHVDGRSVGRTPQDDLQLSPGTHQITLVDPALGLHKEFSVQVPAGGKVNRVVRF